MNHSDRVLEGWNFIFECWDQDTELHIGICLVQTIKWTHTAWNTWKNDDEPDLYGPYNITDAGDTKALIQKKAASDNPKFLYFAQ